MFWTLLGFVLLIAFFSVLRGLVEGWFSRGPAAAPGRVFARECKYCSAGPVLSRGELAFYLPALECVPKGYVLLSKVRLSDLARPEPWSRGAYSRVSQKHVDFVLVELASGKPVRVIELDDRSHVSADSRRRDAVKHEVLAAVGLPLSRVRCQEAYAVDEIRVMVRP